MFDPTPARTTAFQTTPRLAFGNASPTVCTRDHLAFQLDHALARDAVHTPLDLPRLCEGLRLRNLTPLTLHSAVGMGQDARRTYLRRPDLGRTLSAASVEALHNNIELGAPRLASETWVEPSQIPTLLLLLLADGLSALAIERHALPLLDELLSLIPNPCSLIPLVQNARVAIADEIGARLHADITILLIGERPGLSSPDSLGCYITWDPRPGRTDAERNCISNIRGDAGLSYAEAAHRIAHYLHEAQRLHTTGILLKDPATPLLLPAKW